MEYKEKEKNKKNSKEKVNNNNNQKLLKRNKKYLKSKNFLIYQYQSKFVFNFITYFSLIKLFIIIFMNLSLIICQFNKRNILFQLSEVTLKINETGTIQILSDEFFQKFNPSAIYINDIQKTQIINNYNFNQQANGINTVRISWNVKINTTDSMFENCDKIVEIDLSKFETKYVTNMNYMFSECKFLKSINL